MQITTKLFELIEEKKLSILKFSKEIGIPSDRVYQWRNKRGSPKGEDVVKIQNWLVENANEQLQGKSNKNLEEDKQEMSKTEDNNPSLIEKLVDNNNMLTQALLKFSKSSEDVARANLELVSMVKPIANVEQRTSTSVDAKLADFLELLAEAVSGQMKFESKKEALASISKRFYGMSQTHPAAHTQTNSGSSGK